MDLKCKNCKYNWNYKGKKGKAKYNEYTSCPRCKNTVKINNKEVKK